MNETLKVVKLYLKYHSYFNPYPALKAMSTAALHVSRIRVKHFGIGEGILWKVLQVKLLFTIMTSLHLLQVN